MKPITPVSLFRRWIDSDRIVALACLIVMPCAILLA